MTSKKIIVEGKTLTVYCKRINGKLRYVARLDSKIPTEFPWLTERSALTMEWNK